MKKSDLNQIALGLGPVQLQAQIDSMKKIDLNQIALGLGPVQLQAQMNTRLDQTNQLGQVQMHARVGLGRYLAQIDLPGPDYAVQQPQLGVAVPLGLVRMFQI